VAFARLLQPLRGAGESGRGEPPMSEPSIQGLHKGSCDSRGVEWPISCRRTDRARLIVFGPLWLAPAKLLWSNRCRQAVELAHMVAILMWRDIVKVVYRGRAHPLVEDQFEALEPALRGRGKPNCDSTEELSTTCPHGLKIRTM
jgi:hypothetical protein